MSLTSSPPQATAATVRAWDWPTRAFHWMLVACILSAWPSFQFAERLGDPTMKWHRYNGYAILVLIVFRVIWGFVGASTARWQSFVTWPWHAAAYGFDLIRNRSRHYLGHNPLGTYMVLGLLAVVTTQTIIGLFVVEHNETTWGPLYKWAGEAAQKSLHKWHVWIFYYALLPLIAMHITANTLYGIVKHDPLIRAMVTGRKPAGAYADHAEAELPRAIGFKAVLALASAVAIVFGGIVLGGGKLFY